MVGGLYREKWPEIWARLTTEQARVLDQVLAGHALIGRAPNREYAEAVVAYMTYEINRPEFDRRIKKPLNGATRKPITRPSLRQQAWQPHDTEEL
ncbi:hypothetical protein [Antrihabitans stalactiti]|uniref:Uncharacterized protein n=1 Tax=Antrihabitans stalactiti TaxID=2584121 RepID=A0A848KKD5_9NOCA|nr:hypothetical protein [Antrihabitans stalactiti]NMN96720.1 hypothetical protein [Antrihabitans stalactiti]